jgi:putative ABC transport system permease protein
MSRKRRTPPPPDALPARSAGGLRVAFLLARRDAVRSPGRSALIVALIAIPVIGLAGLATVVTSMLPTVRESIEVQLGHTQAMLAMVSPPDKSLVQSPNTPSYFQVANDASGPLNHKESDPLVAPATFLAGERILSVRPTSVTVRTAHGTGSLAALEGEPWDSSLAGRYDRVSGRVPANAHEIMASPAALTRLGARIGDNVSVLLPTKQKVTIVGTLRDRSQASNAQVLFAEPAALDGVTPEADLASTQFYLPDTGVSWSRVRELNAFGAVVLSREVLLNPPPAGSIAIPAEADYIPWTQLTLAFPLAGFALFEVALLAGAAFMVGARRQQRSLATLTSVGGDRRLLFRVIAFGGVVLGVIGGAVGAALGVLGAWIYMRLSSDGSATQYPGFHPNLLVLAGVAVFAALAGLISAAIPARAASRVDVIGALRGALRPQKPTTRRPVVGVVLACVGAGIVLLGGAVTLTRQTQGEVSQVPILIGLGLVVVGAIAMQLGAILLAPLILRTLSRLLAHLGLGARLGSRDVSRNASRSVPALAAIMTTIFIGSFVMTYAASSEAQARIGYDYWVAPNLAQGDLSGWRPNGGFPTEEQAQQVATAIESTFGVSSASILSSSPLPGYVEKAEAGKLFALPSLVPSQACPEGIYFGYSGVGTSAPACARAPYDIPQSIWVGSAADLALALGEPASRESRATLASGGVVSLYPQYVDHGRTTIGWRTGKQQANDDSARTVSRPVRSVSLPATVQSPAHGYHFAVFMSPATAKSIGVAFAPSLVLAHVKAPATDAQYDTLNAAAAAITRGPAGNTPMYFRVDPGPSDSAGTEAWGLLALCALIVLGASSVALGLARADGRRDEEVLGATGASPRLRRSFGFWQAVCLAGTGALIGVVLGVIPVLALSLPSSGSPYASLVFTAPWLQLLLAAVGVPLLIACGTWLTAGGGRVRLARRTTMG